MVSHGSRHTPCAVRGVFETISRSGGRHTACAYYIFRRNPAILSGLGANAMPIRGGLNRSQRVLQFQSLPRLPTVTWPRNPRRPAASGEGSRRLKAGLRTNGRRNRPGDRRIAGQGPDHQQVPRPGVYVEASIGHIRDLPQGAKEIPEQYKKEDWAYLGVNVNHDFEPVYVIPRQKAKQVRKLKDLLKGAKELYLATDEDREGEAISWHLCEVLRPRVPVHRLVFHEITEEAIRDALKSPRQIDEDLVRAQEVRRIVDRLYGYDVSPLLWRKIRPRLSAGRVQSVAVRLIVERERQRMAFVGGDVLGPAGDVCQAV